MRRSAGRLRGVLLAALVVLSLPAPACGGGPAPVEVGSLNVRYANPADGVHAWEHRRDLVRDMLAEGDFWGLQEVLPGQVADLREALPQYGMIFRSRDREPGSGEACPILYRRARWEPDPDEQGTFWLSESPDEAGSRGWDAALPRIATYARFMPHGDGPAVYVYNVHLDHRGELARRESARLLARRIAERRSPDPVVVVGDFNAGPSSVPLATLQADPGLGLVDAWRLANPDAPETGTFRGWAEAVFGERIDFVLASRGLRVESASIDAAKRAGRWPSDHAAVRASLAFERTVAPTTHVGLQVRRVWRFEEEGGAVEIDNDFSGARANGCTRISAGAYRIVSSPEKLPIDASPWYAFRISSERARTVEIRIATTSGETIPWPHVSRDGAAFQRLHAADVETATGTGERVARLAVGPAPTVVAAGRPIGIAELDGWTRSTAGRLGAQVREIGRSSGGRPILAFEFGADAARGSVVVIGRQHPPEVNGSIGLMRFVEALASEDELAMRFLETHRVLCVPIVNPDGVHEGHWRSTLGAVDPNRDWGPFTQVETRVVRDAILALAEGSGRPPRLLVDFHATGRDVLDLPPAGMDLVPAAFGERWVGAIASRLLGEEVESSASGNVGERTFRRWAFETFRAPGITYEVGSSTSEAGIGTRARIAAEEAMRLLLEVVVTPDTLQVVPRDGGGEPSLASSHREGPRKPLMPEALAPDVRSSIPSGRGSAGGLRPC